MNQPIMKITSINQAEVRLYTMWQFGEQTSVFDLHPNIDASQVPVRILQCELCGEVVYARLGQSTKTLCGHDHYCEEAHIDLILQGDKVLYRREA